MSAITLENILHQVEQLPPVEQLRLAYLIEERQAPAKKPPRDKRVPCEPMLDRTRELDWIAKHRQEYAGQWVALDGDRLVAASLVQQEVWDAIKADGAPLPLVDRIPAPDEPLFMGL